MGNSIFGFVEGKWHLTRVFCFLVVCLFFWLNSFFIPFLDSTSAPLTAGEPLNRWVLRGLAVRDLGVS